MRLTITPPTAEKAKRNTENQLYVGNSYTIPDKHIANNTFGRQRLLRPKPMRSQPGYYPTTRHINPNAKMWHVDSAASAR